MHYVYITLIVLAADLALALLVAAFIRAGKGGRPADSTLRRRFAPARRRMHSFVSSLKPRA